MSEEVCPAELDLRGLRCPLPVLRIRKALNELQGGGRILASCDDPLFELDIRFYLQTRTHILVDLRVQGELTIVVIERAEALSQ